MVAGGVVDSYHQLGGAPRGGGGDTGGGWDQEEEQPPLWWWWRDQARDRRCERLFLLQLRIREFVRFYPVGYGV